MKKFVLAWVAVSLLTGTVFGQEEAEKPPVVHKHLPFDMLLGIGSGVDIRLAAKNSQNAKWMFNIEAVGLNYDLYLTSWLSVSTGLMIAGAGAAEAIPLNAGEFISIPFSAHVNVPFVEWLYAGAGIGLNMPVNIGIISINVNVNGLTLKEGTYYTSFPIDLGFDFAKRDTRAGGRLFFRLMPNVHSGGTVTTYGLHWQYKNWKIWSKT